MFVLDGNRKGAIAEAEIYAAAVRLGIPVFLPANEHTRTDMVFEIADRPWRVQCKWGALSADGAVVLVHVATSRYTPGGYVITKYRAAEIDLFGVYCVGLDRCFLLPADLCAERRSLQLRVTAPRNGQLACINLADDYDFEGAVAQLGERYGGTVEATGSSPVSSIPSTPTEPTTVGVNPFRDKLGYWVDRVAAGEEVIVTRHGRPRIRLSPASARDPSPPVRPSPALPEGPSPAARLSPASATEPGPRMC
jgi:prevent-host-death family protein